MSPEMFAAVHVNCDASYECARCTRPTCPRCHPSPGEMADICAECVDDFEGDAA